MINLLSVFLKASIITLLVNSFFSGLVDTKYLLRPNEVNSLKGDYSKAKKLLNWNPRYNLKDLIKEMIEFETNNQYERFSQIYYNKIKLETQIDD